MRARVTAPYDYDELAETAGLSRSRFNTLSKDVTGITPAVYGNALRVEASVAALAEPDISINQITDDLGFSAASNFCRFFQQHTGLTPGEYRHGIIRLAN
jgi:AraC-like DNA-binding protein